MFGRVMRRQRVILSKQDHGFKKLAQLESGNLNGFYIYNSNTAVVHIGNKLMIWNGFPDNVETEEGG